MSKPFWVRLCLVALILCGVAEPTRAQTTPTLPACQPWTPVPQLVPSPAITQDNTLFNMGGYPHESGLTYGVLKSINRGLTWQQFDNPGSGNVLFSPNFGIDRTLAIMPWPFAQAALSNDGGSTWRTIIFPRASPNAFALGDAQHLYLGYGRELPPEQRVPMELLMSSEGGQTWQRTFHGLEVDEIAVSPAFTTDHTLLLALGAYHYNGGLVKSTDAGVTCATANTGLDLSGLSTRSLRFSPNYATDHTLFCYAISALEPGVYKSTDAGATWLHLPGSHRQDFANPPHLLLSPRYQEDQTLWLLDYYKASISRDGGATWQITPYPLWLQAAAEHCRPTGACGVELFGVALEKGATLAEDRYAVYRSFDYGQTWQCLEDTTPPGSRPPAEIPEPATWLLLAGGAGALAGGLRLVGSVRRPG